MKKVISLILAAAFVFALVFSFGGCAKKKSPSERFREAWKNLGAEMRIGPADQQFEIKDANYADVKVELSAPNLIGDDSVTLSFKGGMDTDTEGFVADVGAKYKSSDLSARVECADKDTVFLSFPDVSDLFFYLKMSEMIEAMSESIGYYGSDDLSDIFSGQTATMNSYQEKIEQLIDKYVSDQTVMVATEDVPVMGETVKGAERLSLMLNADQMKSIVRDLADLAQEMSGGAYDEDDLEELEDVDVDPATSVYFTVWTKSGRTVRAEAAANVPDAPALIKFVYELQSTKTDVKANFEITGSSEGEDMLRLPFKYEHFKNGDRYNGRFYLGEGLLLPDGVDEFDGISVSDITFEIDFEGTASRNDANMSYNLKVGAGGASLSFPFTAKVEKAGSNAENFEFTFDSKLVGVTLNVSGSVAKQAVLFNRYDLSDGIKITENMDFDDLSEEQREEVENLYEEISGRGGDFMELIQNLSRSVRGGYGGYYY